MSRTSTPGRAVDADDARAALSAYATVKQLGRDSVRASWRFGQVILGLTDPLTGYTRAELADAIGLSVGTLRRYTRLTEAYQRPELAEEASQSLESYDIGIIVELHDQLQPVRHGRPYAGRRYRYRCTSCHQLTVEREEYDPDTGETVNDDGELVGS